MTLGHWVRTLILGNNEDIENLLSSTQIRNVITQNSIWFITMATLSGWIVFHHILELSIYQFLIATLIVIVSIFGLGLIVPILFFVIVLKIRREQVNADKLIRSFIVLEAILPITAILMVFNAVLALLITNDSSLLPTYLSALLYTLIPISYLASAIFILNLVTKGLSIAFRTKRINALYAVILLSGLSLIIEMASYWLQHTQTLKLFEVANVNGEHIITTQSLLISLESKINQFVLDNKRLPRNLDELIRAGYIEGAAVSPDIKDAWGKGILYCPPVQIGDEYVTMIWSLGPNGRTESICPDQVRGDERTFVLYRVIKIK